MTYNLSYNNQNNAAHSAFCEFSDTLTDSDINVVRGVDDVTESGFTWTCSLARAVDLRSKLGFAESSGIKALVQVVIECTHKAAVSVKVKGAARGKNFSNSNAAAAYAVSLIDAKALSLLNA